MDGEEIERELEGMSEMTPEMSVSFETESCLPRNVSSCVSTHHHGKAATTN